MAHSYLFSSYKLAFMAVLIFTFDARILQARSVMNDEPICMSENCKKTADRLLWNMDQNVDPCNSFYQYACGNWSDEKQSVARLMRDNIAYKLKEFLEAMPSSENSTLTKVKRFYESCLKPENITGEPLSSILAIIDKNGGWPLIMTENEWLSKNKSWQEIDIEFRKIMDFSPLFEMDIYIHTDKNKSPKINFKVGDADPDEHIFSGDLLENFEDFMMLPQAINYRNAIKNISQIFAEHCNTSLSDKKLEDNIKDIIKFEWELEWIKNETMDESEDDISRRWMNTDFDSFRSNFSSMSFKTANGKIDLLKMTKQYFDVLPDFNISGSQEITAQWYYFSKLANLLDRTPSKVIVNTLHWQFIKLLGRLTSAKLSLILQRLLLPSVLKRPFQLETQWDRCILKTQLFLPHLTSYAYIQKYYSKTIINKNRLMTEKIIEGMANLIIRTSLPNSEKEYWLMKINDSKIFVGYPNWYESWYQNKTQLNNEYKDLNMSESYFNNILAAYKFKLIKKLEMFKDNDFSRSIWPVPPLTVNAFHFFPYDAITLLYGMLQNPYFDIEQPEVINYGGIGSTIGHELAHGLYPIQNLYYKNGTEEKWFTSIETKVRDQIRCVAEKYSNYSASFNNKTYHVNPFKTLSENLADILGVQAGYEAFQIRKENDIESRIRLPGLEHLNSNQLYFLSYASVECSSKNVNKLINDLKSTHTPSIFRVDGALSSSSIFAEAFQCPKGTKMNPKKKCDLSNE